MHEKLHQFQDHKKRSRQIVIFFIFDLLFLILALLSAVIQTKYSQLFIIIFILLGIILILHTIIASLKSLILVDNLEDYYYTKSYGASTLKVHQFHKLLKDNLFEYYFQPIINAKTGEVFAYEALMRTNPDNIDMLPVEILDLASKENCLYEIEKFTFTNTLKLMENYSNIFHTKKLFINSITSHQLTDEDFNKLYSSYSSLFQNIILEIAETEKLDNSSIKLIHERLKDTNCQLSLDDYGAVYSNESNLLNSNPDYVKIDRALLRYIHIDTKKQHIVSNLVNSAKRNNIKIIAEGIESYEEFECVINLGVDYIQGFYTAKPEPNLLEAIPEELSQTIHRINNKKFNNDLYKKVYETNGETELIPIDFSSETYRYIVINEKVITLKGNGYAIADISLIIPDNQVCELIFDNLSLHGMEEPSVTLGNNSNVTIRLVGNNYIENDGIRVPESASLTIVGNGNLSVYTDQANKVTIGGTDLQAYGNITLASAGNIKINSSGNLSIGIGGGQNSSNSIIKLLSGNICVECTGYNAIGVGSFLGNARIEIGDCHLKIKVEGTKAVGIGSITGYVDINSSGNLDIRCNSHHSAGVGAIDECEGSVSIKGGCHNINFNSHNGVGIGAIHGKLKVDLINGELLIYGEGTELIGLGDHNGNSQVIISNGLLEIQLFAINSMMSNNMPQKIIIDGGNIQCDFPDYIIPVNSYGSTLVSHIITNTDSYSHIVETITYQYEYKASYFSRYPFIKVYLPEFSSIY